MSFHLAPFVYLRLWNHYASKNSALNSQQTLLSIRDVGCQQSLLKQPLSAGTHLAHQPLLLTKARSLILSIFARDENANILHIEERYLIRRNRRSTSYRRKSTLVFKGGRAFDDYVFGIRSNL
jgi:hypothetical protein